MSLESEKALFTSEAVATLSRALNIAEVLIAETPQISRTDRCPPLPVRLNPHLIDQHPALRSLRKMNLFSVAQTRFKHLGGNIEKISDDGNFVSGYCFGGKNSEGTWFGYVGSIEGKPILSLTHANSGVNGCPQSILLDYDEDLNPHLKIYYASHILLFN